MTPGKVLRITFILDTDSFNFFAPVLEEYLFCINGDFIELSAYDNIIELSSISQECNDYLRGFAYQLAKRLEDLLIQYTLRRSYDVDL